MYVCVLGRKPGSQQKKKIYMICVEKKGLEFWASLSAASQPWAN